MHSPHSITSVLFFFNDTATTEIYTLSLHDALPISIETLAHDALLDGADARHGAGDVQALERHRPVTERLERLLGPEHTGERSLVTRAEQRDQVRLAGAGRLPHLEREPADGRHAFPPPCAERPAPGIAPPPP